MKKYTLVENHGHFRILVKRKFLWFKWESFMEGYPFGPLELYSKEAAEKLIERMELQELRASSPWREVR